MLKSPPVVPWIAPYLRILTEYRPYPAVMNARPRIVIIFTGGTIASALDKDFGGIIPNLTGGQILSHISDVDDVAEILVHEYGSYPGPHITPTHMAELSELVGRYIAEEHVDGVVVTHGTDTLEETAYFLDATVATDVPVVVVGSMRNSSEPDWDGPRNLRDAITVAAHPSGTGPGSDGLPRRGYSRSIRGNQDRHSGCVHV